MQKRPERRYHTASELISDLKRAISNPDGDFVQIPAFVATDSPTINISDDINKIKNGTFHEEDDLRPTKNLASGAISDEEEEELDTVDSKVEKVFLIGTIVAAVVLMIVIIALVAWFLSSKVGNDNNDKVEDEPVVEVTVTPEPSVTPMPTQEPSGDMYVVPDVVRLKEQDARSSILAKAPNADIRVKEDYSDTYEVGEVISQYPNAGNEVDQTSSVILTISVGKLSFPVPNVYGLSEAQADKKLKEKGLIPVHEYPYNDDIPAGEVINTLPERDAMITAGETVTVYISNGPENKQVSVPNLLGKSEAEAETLLKNLGLMKGTVDQDYSDIYPVGQVIYQSYTYNQKVDRNTAIDLTISKGPKVEEPPVVEVPDTYIGSVTIDINPLIDFEDGETHDIILELVQDGEPA